MNTTIYNILVHKWTYLAEVGNNIYASSALNSFIYAIKHALLIYFQKLPPFLSRQNSMLFTNCACVLSWAAQRHCLSVLFSVALGRCDTIHRPDWTGRLRAFLQAHAAVSTSTVSVKLANWPKNRWPILPHTNPKSESLINLQNLPVN